MIPNLVNWFVQETYNFSLKCII